MDFYDIQEKYGFNFNSTDPQPPFANHTSIAFNTLDLTLLVLGLMSSATLLLLINNQPSKHKKLGQRICLFADFCLALFFFTFIPLSYSNRRMLSMSLCQVYSVGTHFFCTLQMTTITSLAYERYFCVRMLQENKKKRVAPHWWFIQFVGIPFLGLHALLPVLSSGAYGAYGLKGNGIQCYAVSGKGVVGHDLYIIASLAFAVVCLCAIPYWLGHSYLMTRAILSKSSTMATVEAAAKAERRSMWFALSLAITFVSVWMLVVIHFLLMTALDISPDWSPIYFDCLLLMICLGTVTYPLLHVYFDLENRKLIKNKLLRRAAKKVGRRIGSSVGSVGMSGASVAPMQGHKGSRVTHFDENPLKAIDFEFFNDGESRIDIMEALFGGDSSQQNYTRKEFGNLKSAGGFVTAVNDKLVSQKHYNDLVKLKSYDMNVLHASTTVRASVEETAAFLHHFDSEYNTRTAMLDMMIQDRILVEDESTPRSNVAFFRYRIPGRRHRDRVITSISTCGKVSPEGFVVYISFPTTSKEDTNFVQDQDHVVKISNVWVYILRPFTDDPQKTSVELYTQLNFELGSDPEFEFNNLSIPLTVRAVSKIQRYFQYLRELESLDDEDGTVIATMLLDSMIAYHVPGTRLKKKVLASMAVTSMLKKSVAMKVVQKRHKWFSQFLIKLLEFNLRPPRTVSTKLADLTGNEAVRMADCLASTLAGNATSESAVDEWMRSFPSMVEFDEQQVWFRSFMNKIAKRELASVVWGVKFRVYLGAFTGTSDSITDIFMIGVYISQGRFGFAYFVLGMIVLSMLMQLALVYLQHKTKPTDLAKEMALTLCFLKPATDAWKISSGKEQEPDQIIDPFMEFTVGKGIELFTEALPATVLQTYAIFTAAEAPGKIEILSLVLSIVAAGYTSSMISYDFDVDPNRRRKHPQFYGYIPDHGRLGVLALMMAMSSCQVASRSIVFALLMCMRMDFAVMVFLAEIVFFLGIKVARGDVIYWIPVSGGTQVVVSLLARIITKTITDFTGFIHSRHPKEMGGALWTLNLFWGYAIVICIAWIFVEGDYDSAISKSTLWDLVVVLVCSFFLVFGIFLYKIQPGYGSTFTSTTTAKQLVASTFFDNSDPETKMEIFVNTEHYWSNYKADVKDYVLANFEDWEIAQPPWWKDKLISRIPEDMLLAKNKLVRRDTKKRRVSSIFQSVAEFMD
jgi:hypothetical protein